MTQLTKNNTVENIESLFKVAKSSRIPVFMSPHYYYLHDHQWNFEGALELLMHKIGMFDRKGGLVQEGFSGPGADWLDRYKPYINDGNNEPAQTLRTGIQRSRPATAQGRHQSGDPRRHVGEFLRGIPPAGTQTMKTQNYHTQDGAIHNGYAHIASLALIDLIAEANKQLDYRVTPEGARGIADVYKTINPLFLASLVLARCPGPGSINAGSLIPGCPKRKHWACSELIPNALRTKPKGTTNKPGNTTTPPA